MTEDRATPVDQYLDQLGRTSEVEIAVSSLDALLQRSHAPASRRAPMPLLAVAAEHVRERRLAERDAETGLKGPHGLQRALREAWRGRSGPQVLLLLRVQLVVATRGANGSIPLLRRLADELQDNVARTDLVARTAEHELSVLMRDVDPRHAPSIGKRLGELVARVTAPCAELASARISVELLNNPDSARPVGDTAHGAPA